MKLESVMGAGAVVAKRVNRRYFGCDLNAEYAEMVRRCVDDITYTRLLLTASEMAEGA